MDMTNKLLVHHVRYLSLKYIDNPSLTERCHNMFLHREQNHNGVTYQTEENYRCRGAARVKINI